MHGMYQGKVVEPSNWQYAGVSLLTTGHAHKTTDANLRYILDTVAESDLEEERWKGVTTLQLLTRSGK